MVQSMEAAVQSRRSDQAVRRAIKPYRIKTIIGDNYGGEWPVQFRKQSITYELCEKHRSELYLDLIPVVNSRRCRVAR